MKSALSVQSLIYAAILACFAINYDATASPMNSIEYGAAEYFKPPPRRNSEISFGNSPSSVRGLSAVIEREKEHKTQLRQPAPISSVAIDAITNLQGEELNALIKRLPSPISYMSLGPRAFWPRNAKKPILVFDLDETLIASDRSEYGSQNPPKFRPGLFDLLDSLAPFYELAIWTASDPEYAIMIIREFDPRSKYFPDTHIIAKDKYPGYEFKPLTLLGFDMRKVVMVDNAIENFVADALDNGSGLLVPTNGISVKTMNYYDVEEKKNEFLRENSELKQFLTTIAALPKKDGRNPVDLRKYILKKNLLQKKLIDPFDYLPTEKA
eukprot:Partr_v1_DN27271_c4_g1_i1_m38365